MARDKKWFPRRGAKLPLERPAGWIERKAVAHIGKLPKLFLYGPVPLIVAWLLTTSGKGELTLKSWGVLLLALWLAIDLWHWMLNRKWRWRFVSGWTGTSLLLIGAMAMMWVWLHGILLDQQEEVSRKLELTARQPGNGKFFDALFTLTNRSPFDIERHALICYSKREKYDHGNDLEGVGRLFSQDRVFIRANGDAETFVCSQGLTFPDRNLVCADLIVAFKYVLITQPKDEKEKDFRFVTRQSSAGYSWIEEPVGSKIRYCN